MDKITPLIAYGANKDALQRTTQELYASCIGVDTHPKSAHWTDEQKAAWVGCSIRTMEKARHKNKETGQGLSDNPHGAGYQTTEVENEGEKPVIDAKKQVKKKSDFPVDMVGNRIPTHLIDIFARKGEIFSYMNQIDELLRAKTGF